jgi:hypothetical protein
MKRILMIQFLLLVLASADAQNEFAATGFYTDFKKIYEDGQTGFANCKGEPIKTGFEELATEYRLKWMLALADSGKLVIPVSGQPYAIYYFEPHKLRLIVDQRSVNLRDAVLTAFSKPLYVRTETTIVNNQPFSTTLYYTDESQSGPALFRQLIYYKGGKFCLSLEIRGRGR